MTIQSCHCKDMQYHTEHNSSTNDLISNRYNTILYSVPHKMYGQVDHRSTRTTHFVHELLFTNKSYIRCEAEFTTQKKCITLTDLMVALCLTEAQDILVKTNSLVNET